MKRIGLIGGISWLGTAAYYETLNAEANKRLGGAASADIILRSFNFQDVLAHAAQAETVCAMMADAAHVLIQAGADVIAVGSSTGHMFLGEFEWQDVEFLHIADALRSHMKEVNFRKVGLLGTGHVLNSGFFAERFNPDGWFELLAPSADDIDVLNAVIMSELPQQAVGQSSSQRLASMISEFKKSNVDAVLLGSTELGYAFADAAVDIPLINSAEVHARAIMDAALATT
ncbi:MAG: amino acid racemase [Pseudomonadota bacterium]